MFNFNLKNFICFCVVMAVGKGRQTDHPLGEARIVGGTNANIEDYPYQLSLLLLGIHHCGAALISSKYAVTAAHCTDGTQAWQLAARYGSSIREVGVFINPVTQFIQHSGFNRNTVDYDISVLYFNLSFLGLAKSIPLCSGEVPDNAMTVITGWGDTVDGMISPPLVLKVAQVPRLSDSQCQSMYSGQVVTPRMLCAGFPQGGAGVCYGDSGGPLVYNGELCGITSWGIGCAGPNSPGVFADVIEFVDFITGITGPLN